MHRTLAWIVLVALVAGCLGSPASPGKGQDAKQMRAQPAQSVTVFPGTYRFDARYSQTLADGPFKVLAREPVFLKSAIDGVDIELVTWRPDTTERVPVIIQASPYYLDTKVNSGIGPFITDNFVPWGYAYTQLAVRSTGNSGGCDDFRGPHMTADMSQAIDWLAEQPWSNGNVTLIGISYVGTTPWYAAGSGNPHIKTIVPISGSTDAWMVYNRNGSAETRSPIIIETYGSSALSNANRTPQHKVENFSCTDGAWAKAYAAGTYAGVTGDKEPFRDFWDERNVKPKVEANYKGSILVVHGFEDWNVDPAVVFPWTNRLNLTFHLPVKTIFGQWEHTYPDTSTQFPHSKRWDWAEILLHWFDYWLKGINTDLGPAAQIQDNQNRWRNEDHWPPIDATWTTLHLGQGGQLVDTPGPAGSVRLAPFVVDNEQLRSGPAPVRIYQDFTWGPFDHDVHIAGLPRVHVTVTPQGPGGYIGAWLLDPKRDDDPRIGWTDMNLRYADGTDRPQTVVPGQPLLAKMEIQPMDAVLPAGHPLVLRVWVNTHSDRLPSLPPTIVDLNYGGSTRSVLELPIIDRPASAFFQPPMPPT